MSWDAIAAVAETLAALGVIASLVYLATQIRRNTRTTRAATFHSVAAEAGTLYQLVAADSEAARIFRIGLATPDELSPDDATRFIMMLSSMFRGYENLFVQHLYGTADDASWSAWNRSMISILVAPGAAGFWSLRGGVFREDFCAHVARMAPPAFPEADRDVLVNVTAWTDTSRS